MKNYGHRRNCSLSVMYPVMVEMVNVDIGETSEFPDQIKETGTVIHVSHTTQSISYVFALVNLPSDANPK